MAISKTICPFFRGTAITKGLFPRRGFLPPHEGMQDSVLVQLIATNPLSAACHP